MPKNNFHIGDELIILVSSKVDVDGAKIYMPDGTVGIVKEIEGDTLYLEVPYGMGGSSIVDVNINDVELYKEFKPKKKRT